MATSLRPKDVAAQTAPLDTAVYEYGLSKMVLHVCFPASLALLCYHIWSLWNRFMTIGDDLKFRWMRVAIVLSVGLFLFFLYAIVRVYQALYNIKQPGYSLSLVASKDLDSDDKKVASQILTGKAGRCLTALKADDEIAELLALKNSNNQGNSLVVLSARYSERLGNNVFQYVVARLRAWMLDVDFVAPPLSGPFSTVPTRVNRNSLARFPSPFAVLTSQDDDRVRVLSPEVRRILGSPACIKNCVAWLRNPNSGYVLNTRLFAGFQETIREWLNPHVQHNLQQYKQTGGTARMSWSPADVAIHVRLGDILWGHHAAYRPLPMSFYRTALYNIAKRLDTTVTDDITSWPRALGSIVIVTEDKTHEIVSRMKPCLEELGLTVFTQSDTLAGDLFTLYTAPNLVLSISSFAWWAAYLASPQTVIVPDYGLMKCQRWHPREDVDALHDLAIRDDWQMTAAARELLPESMKGEASWPALHILANQSAVCEQSLEDIHIPECLQRLIATHCAKEGSAKLAEGLAAFSAACQQNRDAALQYAQRIVPIPLPNLQRWDGDYRHTMDALFD